MESGKVKKFFFEKKNQKTFAPLRALLKRSGTKINKVFSFSSPRCPM